MYRNLIFFMVVLLVSCTNGDGATVEEKAADKSAPAITASIRGEELTYESGGVTLKGFIAWDENQAGARPGVLIVHEWWGHNDYVRNRAIQLAQMGYTALAVDMYGDGKQAAHPQDAQKFMQEVLKDMEAGTARFVAAQGLLQAHPTTDAERTAAIGYCFGGAIVLHMARSGVGLDGVASFHGSLGTQTPAQPNAMSTRILVANGADDPFVPAEQVAGFKAEMDAANADYRFIDYPGAVHGFTNPGATELGKKFDMPLAYNEEADRASWEELDQFLKDTFSDK